MAKIFTGEKHKKSGYNNIQNMKSSTFKISMFHSMLDPEMGQKEVDKKKKMNEYVGRN